MKYTLTEQALSREVIRLEEINKKMLKSMKNLIRCFPSGTSFKTVEDAEKIVALAERGLK